MQALTLTFCTSSRALAGHDVPTRLSSVVMNVADALVGHATNGGTEAVEDKTAAGA